MAKTTLGDKPAGSIIKINENGVPVDFYVAEHDYASGLNGAGRTLVVRKDCYDKRARHYSNSNDYKNSTIDSWLNSTYKALLDADIQNVIGATKIQYLSSNGDGTGTKRNLDRAIFLLSINEAGTTYHSIYDGPDLPIGSTLQIAYYNGSAVSQWTRTPDLDYDKNGLILNASGEKSSSTATTSNGSRPAFTLPSTISVSDDGFVVYNYVPTITSGTASGSDLGTKDGGFDFAYVVNDEDGDAVTVKEYLDGTVMRTYTATLGTTNTFECVTAANYQKILNGTHTLKIVANDGKKDSDEYTVTFSKKITTATVTLANALEADDLISIAVVAALGEIPADAVLQVLVTNNANDTEPVWEDATSSILAGANHVFTNQTAANGFAFNFRLTVTRGESDTGGYITGIGGAFQ